MAGLTAPVGLLERAVYYGLESVEAVRDDDLDRLTPCADWDLRTLLSHLNDSIDVLWEGVAAGRIGPEPPEAEESGDGHDDPAAVLVDVFRSRARRLLRAWTEAGSGGRSIAILEHPIAAELVAVTGAIEIAVHGWDGSVACGRYRPIPATLAIDMLRVSPLVVHAECRDQLFAAPVTISPLASPSDRLVAFLGRVPNRVLRRVRAR
jgi:uncharacterized protein (TIGR03086 family)